MKCIRMGWETVEVAVREGKRVKEEKEGKRFALIGAWI